MLGYGFMWGTRCPTRTPTPTKPINLPQGFPYPCQSLFMIVEKSFINFGVTILLCQNLIAIPLARLPPSVFRSSCPHPLLQRKMNLETETQSQVPKKAECVSIISPFMSQKFTLSAYSDISVHSESHKPPTYPLFPRL